MPRSWIPVLARAVVVAELLMALGLARRATRGAAAALGLAAKLVFMAYHVWVRIAGIDAPCACFGGLRPLPALMYAILSLMLASNIAMVEREGRR